MKNKKLFIYSFAFIVVIRAIALCDFRQYVPYTELYISFMAVWGILLFTEKRGKVKIKGNKPLFAVASLALYDVIFAFSNISVLDTSDVLSTMARSLMMVLFVSISAYWITRYDCLKSVVRITYIFMAVFMTVLFIIHIPETNMIETLSSFWNQFSYMRHRNKFGFIVNNIAAEHALSVIMLSFLVIHEYYSKDTIRKVIIIVDDVLMFLLILANNSRGTLVVSVLMLGVYLFIKAEKRNGVRKVVRITMVIALGVIIGMHYYLQATGQDLATFLYFTNRMHFIANYEILARSGRWLMGLGRTSGAFLANQNYLYGLRTNYMEIFYASVFIQTGIIGSMWILWVLVTIGKEIYYRNKKKNQYIDKWFFCIYFYTLVISLFEDYALSSLYITSTFFLAFMIAYCIKKDNKFNVTDSKVSEDYDNKFNNEELGVYE